MKKTLLLLLISSFFTACKNDTQPKQVVQVANPKTLPDPQVKRYIGLFSHGSAGNSFRPCGRDSTLWAIEDPSGEMVKKYKTVYQYGYDNQSVMAFVEGSLLGKNTEGGTDNTLKITKIEKMEQKDWDGYCMGFEFVVFGSKPFWAVEISPKEGYIDFNDEKHLRYHHFRYVKPVIEGNVRVYRTASFDGSETLKIAITEGDCKDASNPKPYPFSGEVTLNDKVYKGCAQW